MWSLLFVLLVLLARRRWTWLGEVMRQPRVLGAFALSALLLSSNWLTYVWAVQNHHMLDASLGYFILPLVNVAFAYAFLGERPRRGQWMAVGMAALEGLTLETLVLGPDSSRLFGLWPVARRQRAAAWPYNDAGLAGSGRTADCGSAAAVCGWRTAYTDDHARHLAVCVAQYFVPAQCAGVQGAAAGAPADRLCADLGALVVYSLEGLFNSRKVRLVQVGGVA